MTYELKATRINDDGTREDCVLVLWDNFGKLAVAGVQTMKGAIAYAQNKLKSQITDITFEFKDDWSGDPALFFVVTLTRETMQQQSLFAATQAVEEILRPITMRLEPDRHAYFNYRGEDDPKERNS